MYRLKLPATSANLGPGFDALGLAMGLWLEIEARESAEFEVAATGWNAELVGALQDNLLLTTYRDVAPDGPALALSIRNGIPLGMGCGSSAAALLAGVMLANRFGRLGMSSEAVVQEACQREGHPDNVAACFYGGMTVSGMDAGGRVRTASFGAQLPWRLLLALPHASLATEKARALLPERYSRADAVANVQATALVVAAFATGRGELLAASMEDRLHQPYRAEACPLLPELMPMASEAGVLSVSLSGAGPAVLLITEGSAAEDVAKSVRQKVGNSVAEVLELMVAGGVREEEDA